MDNFLDNGAVLPGLLGESDPTMMSGFNKSYKNFPLRIGVVTASYPVSDDNNRSKLTTEYDVLVMEQNEDKGATTIQYRNCLSSEGLGSIADFFEKALRPNKKKSTNSINLKGQDGAIVLLLCLDGMSDKGIIISALTHPDRKTTIKDEGPYLEGEYNGINIKVNTDGSTTLEFKGATDSEGKPTDASQGSTKINIEKDGSYQVDHSTITFRLDKSGTASLTAKKDIEVSAEGKISFKVQGDANIEVQGKAVLKASEINLNGSSGQILTTLTDPVVDLITGLPTQGVPTVKAG